jgi:serine/threonine protein kinase
VVDSKYRVVHLADRGCQAAIFKCEHIRIPRPVALKVAWGDLRIHEGVIKEARVLCKMSHPAIPVVFDAGHDVQGRGYVVTEWIDGKNLARLLRSRTLQLSDSITALSAIASALGVVHAAGWLHLDIKPTNILIPIVSGAFIPDGAHLLDFGLATELSTTNLSGLPRAVGGRFEGTALYMAPEQLSGRQRSTATDLYGVGAVLFEACYGYPPFSKGWLTQRYTMNSLGGRLELSMVPERLTKVIERPSEPDISDGIWQIISELLEHNPADRPASAIDVADRLALIGDRLGHDRIAVDSTGLPIVRKHANAR